MTTDLAPNDHNFLQAMHAAVESEDVGYIYEQNHENVNSCTYLPTDKTKSCIVGRGVLDSGFATPDDLFPFEGKAASQVLIGDRGFDLPPVSRYTAALHPDVVKMSTMVQQYQDSSMPWTAAWNIGVAFLIGKGHDVEHLLDTRDWPNNPND